MRGEPTVACFDELGRVGVCRVQVANEHFAHMEGLVLPDPVDCLEVGIHITVGEIGVMGAGEAASHLPELAVGQLVVVQRLVERPVLRFLAVQRGARAHGELAVLRGVATLELGVDVCLLDRID